VSIGRIAISVVVALGGAAASAGVSVAQDEPVTLTVGLNQDLDSPNVTAGYLVSSFELWTLQYATLTDKASDDFGIIPGLAESWEGSADGLTYTYTLREGLTWSDGEPLTADDIAYTINRSRDEEWLNHSATTANLEATVIDERTVEITTSVPDPKLPVMDVYIVPQHIYEPISAEDVLTYDALDGVGSGPYTLEEWQQGQSWTMVANPSYYGWQGNDPAIDRVVFRIFENGEAMAAALQAGEIDAAHNIPSSSFDALDADPDIVAVAGQQGGFSELAMNAGQSGLGDGHPALLDVTVRQAINKAIDRDLLLERVVLGLGERGTTMSVSPDPSWQPEVPAEMSLDFDPAAANQMLDDAGYLDTDGNGVREMPDGGRELEFRYAQRTESELEPVVAEFITGWLADIGIATTIEPYDDSALTRVIGAGEYDLFVWGWTPFVDPDPMLSYFTCDGISTGPDSSYTNDANWCSEEYDRLYAEQNVELDPERRREIVHEMLLMFYEAAPYAVLFEDADLQAYRTDRFDGWTQQPSEIGPVLFSNTSPSYVQLRPAGEAAPVDTTVASTSPGGTTAPGAPTATGGTSGERTPTTTAASGESPVTTAGDDEASGDDGDDGGGGAGVIVAIVVAVVVVGLGGWMVMRRRGSQDDRE
jgi:peptide/nickel transport system substrate-binding protein